jgi:hypothetical protein
MFRSSTIIRELVLSLAKVMLEHLYTYGSKAETCRSDIYVNASVNFKPKPSLINSAFVVSEQYGLTQNARRNNYLLTYLLHGAESFLRS